MRRNDRAVTDPQKIRSILDRCSCCRIGLNDGGEVYIVPLHFGYTWEGPLPTLYFHGAAEGRKMQVLRQNPRVGLELDTGHSLCPAETACGHTARYQSLIGSGVVEILEDPAEKEHGLRQIMAHYTRKADWSFPPQRLEATAVLRLAVTALSCKEHL